MHELSLAMSVMDIVVQEAQANNAKKIKEVVIEVGELAGVEPICFRTAIDAVIASSKYPQMKATIIDVPGSGECTECGTQFSAKDRIAICPNCGSWACRVTGGEVFRVESIIIE